jgi:hypothetical protein
VCLWSKLEARPASGLILFRGTLPRTAVLVVWRPRCARFWSNDAVTMRAPSGLKAAKQPFAHAGLDFAGNKATPTATSEGRVTTWKRERRFAKLTRLVVLKTRRGKLFHVELTYPADANQVPSGRSESSPWLVSPR